MRLLVLIPVRVDGRLCAELRRLSQEERMDDRIDEGSPLLYYLREC